MKTGFSHPVFTGSGFNHYPLYQFYINHYINIISIITPLQMTKAVKSSRPLIVLEISQILLTCHYKSSVTWNLSQRSVWLRLTDFQLHLEVKLI